MTKIQEQQSFKCSESLRGPWAGLFSGIRTIDHVVVTLIDHFILHKQLPQWVGARTHIIHVTHLMVGGDFSNCSIISPEPPHQSYASEITRTRGRDCYDCPVLTAQAEL